ncbi:MAG: signal peptidase I [Chloroflexi bacterium]|nr:signal peptidase I [Chloroflexota bacterium]
MTRSRTPLLAPSAAAERARPDAILAPEERVDVVLTGDRTPRSPTDWPEEYLHPAGLAPTAPPQARRGWPRAPRSTGGPRRPPLWVELVETALLTLVLFALVRLVVLNFRVDGQSMTPTLSHGQYLLVNRVAYLGIDRDWASWWPWPERCRDDVCYLFGPPQRGDIVVFWPPAATDRPFIKRIIGLPGEQVDVRGGTVLVDGRPLSEPYVRGLASYAAAPVIVPPGQYYVLGDNRNNSTDSHLFGVLAVDEIIGRAWLSYWPSDRWGIVATPRYEAASAASAG